MWLLTFKLIKMEYNLKFSSSFALATSHALNSLMGPAAPTPDSAQRNILIPTGSCTGRSCFRSPASPHSFLSTSVWVSFLPQGTIHSALRNQFSGTVPAFLLLNEIREKRKISQHIMCQWNKSKLQVTKLFNFIQFYLYTYTHLYVTYIYTFIVICQLGHKVKCIKSCGSGSE